MKTTTIFELLNLILPYILTGGICSLVTGFSVLYTLKPQKAKLDAEADKAEADSAESIGDTLEKLVRRCARLAAQLAENDEKHAAEIEKIKRGCAEEIEVLRQMYDEDTSNLKNEVRLLQTELEQFRAKVR